jgi:hypothetical protein
MPNICHHEHSPSRMVKADTYSDDDPIREQGLERNTHGEKQPSEGDKTWSKDSLARN